MADKVENKDIFDADLFVQQQVNAKKLIVFLNQTEASLIRIAEAQKKVLLSEDKKSLKSIENLNGAINLLNEAEKESENTKKDRLKVEKKLIKTERVTSKLLSEAELKVKKLSAAKAELTKRSIAADKQRRMGNEEIADAIKLTKKEEAELSRLTKELLVANIEKQETLKLDKDLAKETLGLVSAYEKESKRLNKLRKDFKSLLIQEGKSTKETKKLEKEIKKLDKQLKEVDASAGQFQRNVGNYPETMSNAVKGILGVAAAAVTAKGAFDGVKGSLDQSAEGSENVREVTSALAGVWDQVSNVVAGAALDVFDYGKAVFESVQSGEGLIDSLTSQEDQFERVSEATTDFTGKVESSIDGQVGLTNRIIEFEKALRPLQRRLVDLNGLIEQQQIIAGDSTRSFEEIQLAILKGQDLQVKRAAINVKIANEELDIAKERIRVAELAGGAGVALLDQETEAQNKLRDAQNDLKNEVLENEKELRQVKQDRLEIDLDILIDGFDNQKTINERIIDNERKTFEERSALLDKTNKLADESFRGQKEVLSELSKAGINIDDLLLLDATELAKQIRLLEQSEIINTRTLEVIRERKIVIQDLEAAQQDLNDSEQEGIDIQKDIISQELALGKQTVDSVEQSNQTLEDLEKDRESNNIESLKRRLDLAKEGSLEFLQIQQELNNALLSEKEKQIKKEEDLQKEALDKQKELTEATIEVISSLLDSGFAKNIENIGKQIDKTGERVDQLRNKANEGQLAAEESLAFEQKKQAELELEREKTRKKQERTKAFFAVLQSFEDNDGNLGKTISDISVLKALAGTLTAYDGVDDTGGRGDVDSKGGKLWTLHPNEQVYSKEDRKDLGFRSREEVKDIVKLHDSGMLNDLMRHDVSNDFINPSSFVLNGMSNVNIERKLEKVNESIKNIKIPEGTLDINEARKLISIKMKQGNKVTIEHSKLFNG